jgi:hypothetical protein
MRIELDLRAFPAKTRKVEPSEPTLFNGAKAQLVQDGARRFAQDPEQVIRLYQHDPETWGGAYVSGDELARMLPTRPGLPWLTYALGGSLLATLPRMILSRRLAIPAQPGERVLLTMGMPASGKTTLVKGGFGRRFFAVVDTPLGDFDLARRLLQEVQASGRSVSFVLAWRPLEEAAMGMLDRAMPGHEERAVPLIDMAELLLKGIDVFLRLADLNRHDGDTTLDVVRSDGWKREWQGGDEAVAFLANQRESLLGMPGSILGQLVQAWRKGLQRKVALGAAVPAILRAIAEDGVDPGAFLLPGSVVELPLVGHEPRLLQADVKSLCEAPRWREYLQGDLRDADAYEERLRKG